MSAFITLDRVGASTPENRVLFENLTLAINAERIGLVGRNGSGKSTLLRLIAGQGEPSSGAITISGRVGELAQRWPDDTITLAEALGVAEGLARLARLEAGQSALEVGDLRVVVPDVLAAAIDRVLEVRALLAEAIEMIQNIWASDPPYESEVPTARNIRVEAAAAPVTSSEWISQALPLPAPLPVKVPSAHVSSPSRQLPTPRVLAAKR